MTSFLLIITALLAVGGWYEHWRDLAVMAEQDACIQRQSKLIADMAAQRDELLALYRRQSRLAMFKNSIDELDAIDWN